MVFLEEYYMVFFKLKISQIIYMNYHVTNVIIKRLERELLKVGERIFFTPHHITKSPKKIIFTPPCYY